MGLSYNKWKLYEVSQPVEGVLHIKFDRPRALNAVNTESWTQFKQIFDQAEFDPDVRAIVLSGNGRAFCAGLDVKAAASEMTAWEDVDDSRRAIYRYNFIKRFQASMSRPHTINKPVIAAVHGFCVGVGIDIISGCDIRYAAKNTVFSIREVDIGMAADMGTLQRMPKLVNNLGWLKETAYTGRDFKTDEAQQQGLIDRSFEDHSQTVNKAIELAQVIAAKSPVAVLGTKKSINYALDHNHEDGLEQIAEFNAHAAGHDLLVGASAAMQKQKPKYAKL